MSQIEAAVYLDVSPMPRVRDQLIAKKLVRRLPDPTDRRINNIELTSKGRTIARQIRKDVISRERMVLEALSPTTRKSLVKGLRELSRAVDEWRSS